MKKHLIFLVIVIILAVGVSWAGGNTESDETGIVMKISDNIPDRTVTWGAVIEQINAEFIKQHPEVKIETESYPDQPYQEKIKIYATAGQLPDVMKYWSFSTLLQPLVDSELVTPLDKADFSDFGWLPGSLESNMYNGELYGIPVSGDLWVIYYNQAILTECGVEPPTTMADLYNAAAKIRAKGYTPVVTDGKDGWPLSITFDNIFWRISGDYSLIHAALDGKKPFIDPEFVKAAEEYQNFFLSSELFDKDLTTSDYGASRNLFGQGRAAMYLMGSWELGLASDTNFPESFRSNVRAMKFPVLASGKGKSNDLVAWFGGNYIINAKTEHMDLAVEYLKLYAKMYPELIWEQQAGFPAQKISPSADDSAVAKDLLTIAGEAAATSGTTALDLLTPAFKDSHQKLCKDLAAGIITPLQFCQGLQKAVDDVNK